MKPSVIVVMILCLMVLMPFITAWLLVLTWHFGPQSMWPSLPDMWFWQAFCCMFTLSLSGIAARGINISSSKE